MKISKIEIKNFRLLRDFSIDLEEELSLVIGKNNSGKTSLLLVLDRFLNHSEKHKFTVDDINLLELEKIKDSIENSEEIQEVDYPRYGIEMYLYIEYCDGDNLANISKVMMDLDPENNTVVIGWEYLLEYNDYRDLREQYKNFKTKENLKKKDDSKYQEKSITDFIKSNLLEYFSLRVKSYAFDRIRECIDRSDFIDLQKDKISIDELIDFKFISARREVSNKEANKTLSGQTSRIYKRTESSKQQELEIERFKDKLIDTDTNLSQIYNSLFTKIIEKVKRFGGVKDNDSTIEIISSLQHRELLEGNTTVVYKHESNKRLPENFNGLGYLNLISIIFEIEILLHEFKRESNKKPADLKLLFIEEPEAHTHPQMQYIFIKNIKDLLKESIANLSPENGQLQYVISTHSAHIVADSDFNDIKYLKKINDNSVISKNLKELESLYASNDNGKEDNKAYRFIKQYLTLNKAEIFFAEKAILIEGDTERILLPAMMKKLDQETGGVPLLSQNISIIEVGAYSQIYEKFLDFIGLRKTLIITDLDSYYENDENEEVPCYATDDKAESTRNSALKFFFECSELSKLEKFTFDEKIFSCQKAGIWKPDKNGNLAVVYQTLESEYCGYSFEDAFFRINKSFITAPENEFRSLTKKHLEKYRCDEISEFDLSQKGVKSKPSFAIEVLLNSKEDEDGKQFSNWQTPLYINEGLKWLQKD